MVMELEYDRSLYGKEHLAGPFEVTKELIQAFTKSLGETNDVFIDEAAALAAGYKGLLAPPTFCTVFVSRVKLPNINLKFGKMQVHAGQRVQHATRRLAAPAWRYRKAPRTESSRNGSPSGGHRSTGR